MIAAMHNNIIVIYVIDIVDTKCITAVLIACNYYVHAQY